MRRYDDEYEKHLILPEPEEDDEQEDEPRRRSSDNWPREAGVYKSWRHPCWGADNSRRL